MTVQELCELFVDGGLQTINLWSHNTEGVIWTGTAEETYDTEYDSEYTYDELKRSDDLCYAGPDQAYNAEYQQEYAEEISCSENRRDRRENADKTKCNEYNSEYCR